jgi:acetyl-CoA hydrolase
MSKDRKAKLVSPEEAVSHVQSGDRVFMTGNCSVPQKLLTVLVERTKTISNVELVQLLAISDVDYVSPELIGHLRVNAMFISGNVRDAVNDGRGDFTPILLSDVPRLFPAREQFPINVALVHLSPPDMHGYCLVRGGSGPDQDRGGGRRSGDRRGECPDARAPWGTA